MGKTTVTFGEIMLRLAPPGFEKILQTPQFVATFGGGEANVAVAVAQLGLPAAFVTVLPDKNPVPPPALGTPQPLPQSTPNTARVNAGLAKIVKNLIAVQLRLSYLNKQMIAGPTALLTADRGPQADINAILLPRGDVSLMTGANDIGGKTTYNLTAIKTISPGIRIGGGVLYSQLGALASFDAGYAGAEARLYNLRNPIFDFYGNFNVAEWAKIFLGERDVTRPDRRTVFGLQLQF